MTELICAKPERSSGIALIKPEFLLKEEEDGGATEAKRAKIDGEKIKKQRGQNKNRFKNIGTVKEPKMCSSVVSTGSKTACTSESCKFSHDVDKYLSTKPPDIGSQCYVYLTKGHCPRGITCRFASGHGNSQENPPEPDSNDTSQKKMQIKTLLRQKKYDFSKANREIEKVLKEMKKQSSGVKELPDTGDSSSGNGGMNPREKKKLDWKNKLYLSPLTTLGNLPFRRICKEWGADITCGEMAMAGNVLQDQSSEWALLRRHPSEDNFGVQICGNNPHVLARCAQLIEEVGDADFIDLNLGCPIELVYRSGAGSGLLRREKHLDGIIRSMNLSTNLPITVKTRTGIYDNKRIALKLMPLFTAAGAALITVHGRTREQRYSRSADWDYINECAKAASPVPLFGNGDILSYQDYQQVQEKYEHISGVMIGRGALYKPWIFTEIKEQRVWDITSSERLDILRKFVNYGFEHWGSDSRGVETTRRFLLEWLSFLYRYIPVGVLEKPQRINERPPRYCGRDDLETLMASPNCADWLKISEMLCGPVPENFSFLPKHKANSWN